MITNLKDWKQHKLNESSSVDDLNTKIINILGETWGPMSLEQIKEALPGETEIEQFLSNLVGAGLINLEDGTYMPTPEGLASVKNISTEAFSAGPHMHLADDIMTSINDIMSKVDNLTDEQNVEVFEDVITLLKERIKYFSPEKANEGQNIQNFLLKDAMKKAITQNDDIDVQSRLCAIVAVEYAKKMSNESITNESVTENDKPTHKVIKNWEGLLFRNDLVVIDNVNGEGIVITGQMPGMEFDFDTDGLKDYIVPVNDNTSIIGKELILSDKIKGGWMSYTTSTKFNSNVSDNTRDSNIIGNPIPKKDFGKKVIIVDESPRYALARVEGSSNFSFCILKDEEFKKALK